MKSKKLITYLISSVIILAAAFAVGLIAGRYNIKISSLFGIIFGSGDYRIEKSIILNLRLPRTIVAALTGAALSVSGLLYQETFQNKLVSPDLLGVSSGAGVGAAIAIILGLPAIFVSALSFVFGVGTVFLTLFVANIFKSKSAMTLPLAGIIVGGLAGSLLSFVKYLADAETTLASITFWLMGSFESATMKDALVLFILTAICLTVTLLISYRINLVALGEEEAKSRGINYKVYRLVVIFLATLLTASAVSVAGTISWIGLVIPHIVRLLIGRNTKKTVPLSITIGAIFMIISDVLSRTFTASEIPISAITGFFGTVIFVIIMARRRTYNDDNN